jgi:hypothetical protein
VDTTLVTVGDPITLAVTVDHPAGTRVAWPDSLDLSPFEVVAARLLPPASQGEGMRSRAVLTLAAFELGELEIPGFEVEVVDEAGESTTLETDRFAVLVESVGLDESGDIRELKGPLGIPISPVTIGLWVLGILLVGGALWALMRRLRQGQEEPLERRPLTPPRPPHEVALEALAELEASPLLERGEVKEYHIRVSDILRAYVEGRFRVPALEMTTTDVMLGMEARGIEISVREAFRNFLEPCDMVKFAKSRPDDDASRAILALGRKLVEETTPVFEEPTKPGSPQPEPAGASAEATGEVS